MRLSFRARLTAWYVGVLAAIIAVLGVFVAVQLRSELEQRVERSLEADAAQLARAYPEGRAEFVDVSASLLHALPQGPAASQVLDGSGHVLVAYGRQARRPMVAPDQVARALSAKHFFTTRTPAPTGQSFRLWVGDVTAGRGDRVLVVGQSLRSVEDSVASVTSLLVIGGLAALLAAAAGGWWLARRALRPVGQMAEAADRIGIDRIHERLSEPKREDELGRLGRTLNRMLERIERGVEEKQRLVADASHELRTPLAVMRSEVDVTLLDERLDPEAHAVLESAREEIDRMTRIVENLLTLARVDEGGLKLLPAPVSLRDLAANALEPLQPGAAARGVEIKLAEGEAVAQADADLVRQVVTNLLDNALKYSERGSEVEVRVWSHDGRAGLTVKDSGPGIPAEARSRVFDRFYRVDASRTRSSGGSGLGLSISKEIIRAHGGRIWVESADGGGSSFSFEVPGSNGASK
jgi:heavy metal sensor kinase